MEKSSDAAASKTWSPGNRLRLILKKNFRLFSWLGLGVWLLTMYALLHVLRTGF
ncbi:hypothetical protein [Robiginitalea sediminis]|uniref:hypothetical protein n=1 Tax=Robiginitalea sediminis TaxID=1982593 RepID=UPI0013038EF2|nr:hypothetical protein [Robiginitalea sediminis]